MPLCLRWCGVQNNRISSLLPDPRKQTPYQDVNCMVFESDTPSHELWMQFVDNCNAHGWCGLSSIVKEIEHKYDAKFHVASDAWWFEFPSPDVKLEFTLAWT